MKNIRVERYYPEVAALMSAAAWCCFDFQFPENSDAFLSASLTFSAILIGFLSTTQAIIMSLPSGSAIDILKTSGYINILTQYLRLAIYGLLVFSIFNLLGFFRLNELFWYEPLWVASGMYSLASFQRMVEIFIKIMRAR